MQASHGAVSPPVAAAFATVLFFALVVAGFGLLSLREGAEVIGVPGLGQAPGVIAMIAAVLAFATGELPVVRRPRPTYPATVGVVAGTFLAYTAGIVVGAVLSGAEPARAAAAAGGFVTSWFAVALASAALVCGWGAVALVRTRAQRPRWPWEDRERRDG